MDFMASLPESVEIDSPVYANIYNNISNLFKKLYEKTAYRIPKKIHFIWIGSKLNSIQKDYIKLWAKLNPDYKVNFCYD